MAMNYNTYGGYPNNQYYMNDLQSMRDRIDRQIAQLQQQPMQTQQPTPITQNFQLAPNNGLNGNKSDLDGFLVNDIQEVKNKIVFNDTFFINKDYTLMWKKDTNGNIKTFTIQEVVELDEKDKKILSLQKEIEEMKGLILNGKYGADDIDTITKEKSASNAANKSTKK